LILFRFNLSQFVNPVTIGNLIGGGFFVGTLIYFTHAQKPQSQAQPIEEVVNRMPVRR
jgi:formate/nitrite transporter FocA (FNT family)